MGECPDINGLLLDRGKGASHSILLTTLKLRITSHIRLNEMPPEACCAPLPRNPQTTRPIPNILRPRYQDDCQLAVFWTLKLVLIRHLYPRLDFILSSGEDPANVQSPITSSFLFFHFVGGLKFTSRKLPL